MQPASIVQLEGKMQVSVICLWKRLRRFNHILKIYSYMSNVLMAAQDEYKLILYYADTLTNRCYGHTAVTSLYGYCVIDKP